MSSPSEVGTQPLASARSLTVKTLAVEVLEGPDVGVRVEAPEDRLTIGGGRSNHLVLTDRTVSRFHLELTNSQDGIVVRDLGSKNGTYVGAVALERARVPTGTELLLGRSRLVILDGDKKTVDAVETPELRGLLGASAEMRRLMGTVKKAAKTKVPVLILGESGTGKELIARAVHEESERADKPFVVVDCGALTPTLITSALFGHERGSFTGADRRRIGAFERADGGTVFLDEVGELAPELQPLLLGVLERQRFQRVGGTEDISIDVRVVCATNRDLRSEVNRGSFREDLYYRLSVVHLEVPPLRERLSDVLLLAEHFFRETGSDRSFTETFDADVVAQMSRHDWPGNVRELRNFVEALVALGEAPAQRPSRPAPNEEARELFSIDERVLDMRYSDARADVLQRFEREYLSRLIESTGGNVSGAARLASMDRSYLIKLLEKHQLK